MKSTISSGPLPRGTPSSFNRNWPVEGSTSSCEPCNEPSRPSARKQRAEALATVRFETPPGQQMQIDFGEKIVRIAGQPVKVYLMTAVLGYSRRLYCRAFLAQRQDDWLEGLDGAFRHFGGLTEQILCDNASPLVISHDRQTGHVVWNPGFETFCRDRGLTAKACRPRRAGPRGRSNAASATSSTMPWPDDRSPPSTSCSGTWRRWMVEVADQRIHGTTGERPCVRFERDERQALRPLPTRPLAVRTRRLKRRVSTDCFVDIDTIRYSVPYRHVRETVEVVVEPGARRDLAARDLHRPTRAVPRAPHVGPQPGPLRGAVPARSRHAHAGPSPPAPTPWPGRCRSTPRSWKEVGHERWSTRCPRNGSSRR